MDKKVQLIYDDKTYEFPLVEGTEKELGIDIKSLRAQTGLVTLDPGFKNSGSCQSEITFLNGEKGELKYTVGTVLKILQLALIFLKFVIC